LHDRASRAGTYAREGVCRDLGNKCFDVRVMRDPVARIEVAVATESELAACVEIRREVFVVGQGVPEHLEVDGLDARCWHYCARVDRVLVGTARARIWPSPAPGERQGRRTEVATPAGRRVAKIERVAVLQPHRRCGVGRALMAHVEAHLLAEGVRVARLSAQRTVEPFYARAGYRVIGAPFIEAGIEHVPMEKPLASDERG